MYVVKGDTVKRHNRVRPNRGITESFSDLPEDVQEKFKIAKEFANKLAPDNDKVYVFGSYLWGWYDEHSDIDIAIPWQSVYFMPQEFTDYMAEKHGFKCNIQMLKQNYMEKTKLIEIE